MAQVRALQGDTVDLICRRYLGQTAGLVEKALELNAELATLGPILPVGTLVTLPEPAPVIHNSTINLWD